jgi:hypothetical protein
MYQQEVKITVFDGGITPKQLQDIACSGDPKMGDLFLAIYGMQAWLDDGSMVDLEEFVDEMTVPQAVNRVLEIKEYIKILQEVVDEMRWEAGYIEGKKGMAFYDEEASRRHVEELDP